MQDTHIPANFIHTYKKKKKVEQAIEDSQHWPLTSACKQVCKDMNMHCMHTYTHTYIHTLKKPKKQKIGTHEVGVVGSTPFPLWSATRLFGRASWCH